MTNEHDDGADAHGSADEDEILDDDFDWDYELGLLEPAPEPTRRRERWVARPPTEPVLERDRRVAVLTPGGVGEFLRACRTHSGLSQRQLADAAGISQTTVARLESGRTQNVQLATVTRLADACGVSLVGCGEPENPEGPSLLETDLAQRHRDGGDRMLPAHLANRPTPVDHDGWWADCRYTVQAKRRRPARTHTRGFRYRDLPEQ